MSFFKNSVQDSRIQEYVPVHRVLLAEGIEKREFFVGRPEIQPREVLTEQSVCSLPENSRIVLDFGAELNGGVRILTGYTGGKIRLRFGESVSEAIGRPDQSHSIHDETLQLPSLGVLEYGNTGFRFICIDALTDLQLLNIVAVARYRSLTRHGSFTCSDERLNNIWETCVRTVHLNMQEYLFDGIKRDRLVWMGDLHPEISVINLVFGDTSIVRDSLDFVRDNTPLPEMMNTISSYSLWWIICQRDYFLYHGDLAYLKSQYPYLKGLSFLLAGYIRHDGCEQLPEKRFIDWPTEADKTAVHAGLQALMVTAFRSITELAYYLEDTELLDYARKQLNRLLQYPAPVSSRKAPNALLAISGLADTRQVNEQILSVNPTADLGTFMGYYTLYARGLAGDYDGMLNVIRQYWGAMLDFGATTFWEDFDLAWTANAGRIDELPVPGKNDLHADFGAYCYTGLRHSLCHGWAGGPAAVLSKFMTGLTILEPGFRKINISPVLGDLDYLHCKIPTPAGILEIEADKRTAVPKIILPEGVTLNRSTKTVTQP